MSDSAVKKAKNNRVAGTVTTVILVIAVLLCLFVAFQVLGNGYATFGKVSMFRVVTGSMEPEIPVGSLIMSEKVDIDEINIVASFFDELHKIVELKPHKGCVIVGVKTDKSVIGFKVAVKDYNYISIIVIENTER